jgi:predicted lipoprotein with Yx(FWY)xxD motif
MWSKIHKFVPVVVMATMLLASAVAMVPAAMATDGAPYLDIIEGQVLWQESTAGNEVVVSAELVDDLDGDGLPDVLVRTSVGPSDNQTYTAIAKKGSDGSHLWEESISGNNAYIDAEVVGDLDGDSLPDVLVRTSVGPSDNQTYTVIAKKGSDGSHLWEESTSGNNAHIEAQVVGDLDGDGLPDVLVNSYVGPEDNITATVIAKKGSDGTHLWEESISGDYAYIYAEVVGDLDGDGLPDVLVNSGVGPYDNATSTLIAKKGSDGTHLWEESISGYEAGIDAEVVADLDGDGLPDVMVNSGVGPDDNVTSTVIAKKGSNGNHLWEESISGYEAGIDAEVVADLDGDGLPDVLVRSCVGTFDNQTATVIAKKGSNGTHLWEEPINGYDAIINYEVVADLDDDGVPDVLVSSSVGPYSNRTYTVIAEKGSDGTHLWEESVSGSGAYNDISAEVVADLDGDGLPDVLVHNNVGSSASQTFTVIAKKGSDGTHLWEESVSGNGAYTDIQAEGVAADFDGDGLPDVLVQSSANSGGSQTYTAIGKKGSDGTHLWEAASNEVISFPRSQDEDREPLFYDLNGDGKADALIRISNQVCAVSVGEEAPPPAPSLPAVVPSVTQWGTIGMIAAFGLILALMARRRLVADKGIGRQR